MALRKHIYSLTALTIAAFSTLAVWLHSEEPRYPVVRAVMSEGITLTFIGLPWNDARRCEEAHSKVVNLLHGQCPSCRLTLSECRQQLTPSWGKAFRGESGTLFAVYTDSQRIVIEADYKIAREICTAMVAQIEKQGRQRAHCIIPQS